MVVNGVARVAGSVRRYRIQVKGTIMSEKRQTFALKVAGFVIGLVSGWILVSAYAVTIYVKGARDGAEFQYKVWESTYGQDFRPDNRR